MDHQYSREFSISSLPNAIADAVDCTARTRGDRVNLDVPPEYGRAFGMNLRFRTQGGEAPVLRTMWEKESDAWRLVLYDIETP